VLEPATSPREALLAARRTPPEWVLLDLDLYRARATLLPDQIRAESPGTRFVGVAPWRDGEAARELPRGFYAYVTKDTSLEQFVATVRAAVAGDPAASSAWARRSATLTAEERHARFLAGQLTARELDVLALLAEGASGEDIGERLSISANTVRTHVQSILTKLGLHSRLEAVTFAIRHRIVEVPSTGRDSLWSWRANGGLLASASSLKS
jgi:two-component system nitrate/nitrite response regulator NarL